MKFRKDMSIQEALQLHPGAIKVFIEHGLECSTCLAMNIESVEDGAKMHGIDPTNLIEDLNRLIEKNGEEVKSAD